MIAGELDVDWADTLTRVTCPTLLLRATDPFGPPGSGPILTASDALRTIARLPHGRLAEISGNHVTFLFGAGARRVVDEVVAFVKT